MNPKSFYDGGITFNKWRKKMRRKEGDLYDSL
jgi:hypothetical protein